MLYAFTLNCGIEGLGLGGMTVQIVIAFGAPIWLVTMC